MVHINSVHCLVHAIGAPYQQDFISWAHDRLTESALLRHLRQLHPLILSYIVFLGIGKDFSFFTVLATENVYKIIERTCGKCILLLLHLGHLDSLVCAWVVDVCSPGSLLIVAVDTSTDEYLTVLDLGHAHMAPQPQGHGHILLF